MPQSKTRSNRLHAGGRPVRADRKKNHAIIYVAVIFFTAMTAGIMYMLGMSNQNIIIGAIAGAIPGYLFGYQIDKYLNK